MPAINSVGKSHTWWWLLLSLVMIALDQLTKWWASSDLQLYQSVQVFPFLNWTLMHNTGAAFSFLADAGGWQRWFFISLTFAVTLVLLVWLSRTPKKQWLLCFGLSLVIGGAIGNVIDRIFFGYVIDFIDVFYQQWHWPAFNIADSAIMLGVGFLLIDSFTAEKDESLIVMDYHNEGSVSDNGGDSGSH